MKPSGSPQDILAKQSELARKAFDAAVQNTNDIAELVKKTNADAFQTLAGRITESVNEMRGTLQRGMGRDEGEVLSPLTLWRPRTARTGAGRFRALTPSRRRGPRDGFTPKKCR